MPKKISFRRIQTSSTEEITCLTRHTRSGSTDWRVALVSATEGATVFVFRSLRGMKISGSRTVTARSAVSYQQLLFFFSSRLLLAAALPGLLRTWRSVRRLQRLYRLLIVRPSFLLENWQGTRKTSREKRQFSQNVPGGVRVIEITGKVLDACHVRFYREVDVFWLNRYDWTPISDWSGESRWPSSTQLRCERN